METTRYVRSGEIYLAYQVLGEGPRTVLFVSGFLSHLELMWEEPSVAAFYRRLAEHARVILFDKRGIGLSDRVGAPPRPEDTVEDMRVILDAVGCEQAVLAGGSEGGPVTLLFGATYPRRTSHLILYGTMPKWVRSYDYPWALSRAQYDRWLDTLIANWGTPVSLPHFAPSQADDPAVQDWWARMLRQSATPGSVKTVLETLRDIDVRDVLPHVHVPGTVIHRTGDRIVPLAGAKVLAQRLPNCRWVELSGHDHWWWAGDAGSVLAEIERALAEPAPLEARTPPLFESLTARELDVLRLIAAGYTNQQIANELYLGLGTIKTYSSSIYGKLNVANRTQAVEAGRKQGLIR